MNTGVSVEVLNPSALTGAERTVWRGFTAASPRLGSPFFSIDYALAADGVVPGASVAVVHQAGAIKGFLPFQRRGSGVQPLAAPLSDYHGLITAPGCEVDLHAVLRLLGASSYRFNGLVADAIPPGGRCFAHGPMVAELGEGLEAYLAARPKTRKFFKDKERATRAAERSLGPLEFEMEASSPELFDFVLAHKREQYRQTARHDIFACGWTQAFLRRLWEERTPGFGAQVSSLRAGGRLIAAEFGLKAGTTRHIWFPTYDPDAAQFGPGTLLMIRMIRAAAEDPTLSTVDFGTDGEGYKRFYAEPRGVVYEGSVEIEAWRRVSERATDKTLSALPALQPLAEVRERMRRRFAIIDACETTTTGRLGGAADAFRHASRRAAASAA